MDMYPCSTVLIGIGLLQALGRERALDFPEEDPGNRLPRHERRSVAHPIPG